jgi:VCBS repeat-containing protein
MKKGTGTKTVSMLMTLAMGITLLPALSIPAKAATTTYSTTVNSNLDMYAWDMFNGLVDQGPGIQEYSMGISYDIGNTSWSLQQYDSVTLHAWYDLENDDTYGYYGFGSRDDSLMRFNATATGTYTFHVNLYDYSGSDLLEGATITVTASPANAAPAVTTPTAISLTDTSAADTFANTTGTISASDSDGTIASYGISSGTTGGSFSDGGTTYDVSKAGTYGTLYAKSSNGSYAYVPNATAINAVTANQSETFTVTATDDDSATGTATLTVNIIGANDTPANSTLSNSTVNQSGGTNATVGTLSTTDADSGQTYTYSLVSGNGTNDHDNASFNISGSTLRANNAANLAAGTYYVYIRTTDSGSATYDKAFTITVSDDTAPTVSSVAVPSNGSYKAAQNLDFTVNFDEAVTVTTTGGTPRIALTIGSSTVDAAYQSGSGTTALTFRYTVQSGDNDSNGIAVGALSLNGGTIKDAANNAATLTLNSVMSTASVLVDTTAPTAPTPAISADVGASTNDGITKTASQTITVSGEAGTSVDLDFGDSSAHATGTIGAGGTFTASAHTFASDSYTISATLTDTAGNTSTAGTKAVVIDTTGPSVTTSASQTISTTAATNGANVCTLSATDATSISGFTDALAWSITGGADAGKFTISGSDLKINNSGGLSANSYTVQVTATDTAGNTNAQTITITVVSGPTVSSDSQSYTDTAADDTFGNKTGTISATANSGSITGYGISGGTTGGSANIGGTAYDVSKAGTYGTLYVNSGSGAYVYVPTSDALLNALSATVTDTFTILATDSAGTAGDSLTITINGVNDTPTLSAPSAASYTDTSASDTFSNTTGTLAGADRDTGASLTCGITGGTSGSTTIGGTAFDVYKAGTYGTLYVNSTTGAYVYVPNDSAINALTASQSDTFTVTVSDGTLSATQTCTVNITGANDAPTITSGATTSFAENGIGTVYTATRTDPDSADTGTWSISGTDAALFNIDSSIGSVSFKTAPNYESPTDSNSDNVYDITVTATDSGSLTDTKNVSITVTNVNEAPVISSSATASFAENGTGTAYTATATDPEGSTVTWSLSGTDAGLFSINSSTGAITFTSPPSYSSPADNNTDNSYELTVTASDGALTSSKSITITVTKYIASSPSAPSSSNVDVNGQSYSAGTTTTTTNSDGQTQTTVTVDTNKLDDILSTQGQGATVTVPVTNGADVATASLTGDMMNTLQGNGATFVIETGSASYSLPTANLDMDAITQQFGANADPTNITVEVSISEPASATVTVVADAANSGGFTIQVPAVDFTVTCSYNGQTATVSAFSAYVQRTVAIPDGVDPTKITTGIVLGPDGTVHHVPTKVTIINGKYYAVINSLTNSTYTVIWHPVEFADVTNNWAKDAINDMGSRMVVTGVDGENYQPDRDITRAEFAAIVVRALGLEQGMGTSKFSDVKSTDWYYGYVETASGYNLIKGYDDGTFRPYDKITRQEAMAIIARAMVITKLSPTLTDTQIAALFAAYTDSASASSWADAGVAACLKTGIITGRTSTTLNPKDNITRAEVAVIVQRLLQKSGLI